MSDSAIPFSNLKSENHAVPLQFSPFPPNLNPISTVSLFLELNINSTSCQSLVPVTLLDAYTVFDKHICAPEP